MNTANLQLEGLLLAFASINQALVRKGVLDSEEIEAALAEAETLTGRNQAASISPANRDAISFPIRFLKQANRHWDKDKSFAELARAVGESNQPGW